MCATSITLAVSNIEGDNCQGSNYYIGGTPEKELDAIEPSINLIK